MSHRETIFVIVAHSDDQILGPGGTLAKYAREGKRIITIIFSYGEVSHFYFKKEVIAKMRIKEAEDADKIIGGSEVIFFGINEGKFKEEFEKGDFKTRLQELFFKYKPNKIFTHSITESHPDHRAVHDAVLKTYDELAKKELFETEIYSFALYGIRWKISKEPRLIVNISKEFPKKLEAIRAFKSQHTIPLWWLWLKWMVYYKAIISGLKIHSRFAEEFYKLR